MTVSNRFSSQRSCLFAVALIAGAALAVGCGEADGTDATASGVYEADEGLMVELEFEPDPPTVGEVDLDMEVTAEGTAVEEADIEVEPWMPAHGHGSNTEAVVHHEAEGHYRVDDLSFSMAGSWELRIDVATEQWETELIVDLEVQG